MYDARIIANEVLRRGWQMDRHFTQLDIQKICYFLNGHHLIDHGHPMIKTDFEAWRHGPVQRSLYDSFRKFGDEPITDLATAFDPIKRQVKELPLVTSNSVQHTIAKYLDRYASIPAHELVGLTHRQNTPWDVTRTLAKEKSNLGMIISTDTILRHFEGLHHA